MEKVRACIQLGVNVNHQTDNGMSPLFIAIAKKNLEIFNMLVSCPQIDVNKIWLDNGFSFTPLMYACGVGAVDMVKSLLSVPGIE